MCRQQRVRRLHSQQQCRTNDRIHSGRLSASGRSVTGNAECYSKWLSSEASSPQPLCRLLLPTYLHVDNSTAQIHSLKDVAKQKSMYVADQSSKSRSRSGVLNKEKTSGEFTLNPDPITIYRQRAVFEPNPSQQGLKLCRLQCTGIILAGL